MRSMRMLFCQIKPFIPRRVCSWWVLMIWLKALFVGQGELEKGGLPLTRHQFRKTKPR